MSEVVKKLITELGFKLTDKKILDDYKNVSKVIAKGQKDQTKTLKSEVAKRNVIEKDNTKQLLKETDKLFKDFDKDQLKRKQNFQKNLNKYLENVEKVTAQKRENRQKIYNALNDEHNKILKNRAVIEKDSLKRNLDNDIAKAQARQKEYAQNQRNLALERDRIRLNQQQQERDKTTRQYREGVLVSRTDKSLIRGVNERLKPQGKQMLPNGQIVDIPKEKKPIMDKQAVGQMVLDAGAKIGDKTQNIVMSSIDMMLEFGHILTALEVRGELSKKQVKELDITTKDISQKWGTNILETGKTLIELSKSGITGDTLKFMGEEITMLSRSLDASPEVSMKLLNTLLHQQRQNIQSPEAIKKGIPLTQDKQAIKRISNAVSAAVNASALDPMDLLYNVKYAGTSSAMYGQSIEEFLFNSARLGNVYLKGSTGGTTQRKINKVLTTQLEDMLVSEEKGTGKKKGKKRNALETAYSLKDFGIYKKDFYKEKGQKPEFRQASIIMALTQALKKKGFDRLKRATIVGDMFGLTAQEGAVLLGEELSPEEKIINNKIKNAGKTDETRRVATAMMQSPKTKLAQTTTKKDIAMINLGEKLKPELGMFTSKANQALDLYNQSPKQQQAGKGLAIGGLLTGGASLLGALGVGAGIFTVGTAGLAVAGVAGSFVLLHDAIAVMRGDGTILGSLGDQLALLINGSNKLSTVPNIMNTTAGSIRNLSKALQDSTAEIQQFLGSYGTMEKLGIVEVGVKLNRQTGEFPIAPGQKPITQTKPTYYFMNNATANRKG